MHRAFILLAMAILASAVLASKPPQQPQGQQPQKQQPRPMSPPFVERSIARDFGDIFRFIPVQPEQQAQANLGRGVSSQQGHQGHKRRRRR